MENREHGQPVSSRPAAPIARDDDGRFLLTLPGEGEFELEDGDELEVYMWRVDEWRPCRFRTLLPCGSLEIELPAEVAVGVSRAVTPKALDGRDLFRLRDGVENFGRTAS